MEKLEENDNFWYIASYPRSGNTWCRIFVSEFLKLEYENNDDEDYKEYLKRKIFNYKDGSLIMSSRFYIDDFLGIESSDLKSIELDRIRPGLNTKHSLLKEGLWFRKVHDAFFNENKNFNSLPIMNCKGVLYLIRHPYDVAVSLSNFFSWDLEKTVNFMIKKNSFLNFTNKNCSLQVMQYLGSWNHHVESWNNQKFIPILTIRYEDLQKNPNLFFKKILDFLEIKYSSKSFNKALKNSSFSRLQNLENSDTDNFGKPLACKEFFRLGRAGEGINILDNKMKDLINKSCDFNMRKYGYFYD